MRIAGQGRVRGRAGTAVLWAAFALGGMSLPAAADEKPLWELGAGFTVLNFPAYRGSDETSRFVLPLPYVVYRGEFLKADRRGLRGMFFDSENVEVSLSAAASPPVSSEDVEAREGMPDLHPTVEIGPSVDVTLWRNEARGQRLTLRMPLRAGITVEGSPRSTGWLFSPHLNLDWRDPPGMGGWNLGFLAGPLFADSRQHEYFYGVSPRHATPGRPAYDARGGYAGTQFLAALTKRFPSYWVGGFVRYDTLAGAVFEDSPLVTSRRYLAAGVAITWVLGESSRRVQADE